MKIRYFAAALVLTLAVGICGIVLSPAPKTQIDPTEINDITSTLATEFDRIGTDGYTLPGGGHPDYAVLDTDGNLRAATRRGLSEDSYSAIRHGDTTVDIILNGQILGKVIFNNDADVQWQEYRNNLQLYLIVILSVIVMLAAAFLFVLNRKILRPFQSMRSFAGRVAAGELDIPLEMNRQGAFGAFTESFDLMRDELRRARENERAAEQSKRELVASLSHDIQTPVASIRAVAELMEVTAEDSQRPKLQTILQKSEQIHALVAELFHTTLEELDSLSVRPVPFPSDRLAEIVRSADYRGKVRFGDMPGCLVQADPVRLAQVMDNIISNSYKYADTDIDFSAEPGDDGLTIILRDFGTGADPDELPLLCGKYYRGKCADGKDGYGLGLFIARALTERMSGLLECENAEPGFAVRIWLKFDD